MAPLNVGGTFSLGSGSTLIAKDSLLSVTAAPTNVGVGDPITVRIQIAGRGPLDALTLPAQPEWRDFNTYPATAKVEPNDDLGLSGVKHFEQVIVPQNHELKEIPPLRFSYFDTQSRTYVTRTGPRIPLNVHSRKAIVAATRTRDQRNRERQSLACAGLRGRHHVAAFHERRNCLRLDGRWSDEFVLSEVVPQRGAKIEFGEMLHRNFVFGSCFGEPECCQYSG